MNIQIISKGDKRSPQCKHLKENSLNRVNIDLAKSSVPFYQEYYPAQSDREQPRRDGYKNQVRDLFYHFNSKCVVVHEKVHHEPIVVKKKLEPILDRLKDNHMESPKNTNYEFTFKKVDILGSTNNSKTTTESKENMATPYYMNQPKQKIRKFHSSMSLNTSQSQREKGVYEGKRIEVRKNCSVVKYDSYQQGNLRGKEEQRREEKNRLSSDYSGLWDLDKKATVLYKAKTEKVFEQEKQRLGKIRRQLNEVYQMRKPQRQLLILS